VSADTLSDLLTAWNTLADARYLAELRPAEVARALRALSSAYVERRHAVASGLESAGKRAAFALYYAPLHMTATAHVVRALDAAVPPPRSGDAIVAAYLLNELAPDVRRHLEDRLLDAASRGARVLVLEPIARAITPWWNESAARVVAAGGRADEWELETELPSSTALLGKAAGLNSRELKVRTLYLA
jgi:hypothetical protein